MPDRLAWQRDGEEPRRFVAYPTGDPAGGSVRLWWRESSDSAQRGWTVRVEIGKSVGTGTFRDDREAAIDFANQQWRGVAREEAARLAKVGEQERIVALIEAAAAPGGDRSAAPFEIETSSTERLLSINWHLKERGLLGGLKPIADAVSAELFLRRTGERSGN